MAKLKLFPVIMAGGSGTRFWPQSRVGLPKQFLPLTGTRPMIALTLERLTKLAPARSAYVVCGERHAKLVKRALPKLPGANILVEPQARNTAPAIALATAHVAKVAPEGILVVLPSDQHVLDVPGFTRAVEEAAKVAAQGHIVTLGITPSRPETGYGYIRVGAPLSGTARKVAAFVEKPDRATAEKYLAGGDYLWNAGIFVFRADVMLAAFQEHMPELHAPLTRLRKALGTRAEKAALQREFAKMPATSIDYGVAERAANIAVVPGDFGWSDVGSFAALPEVRKLDEGGNVVEGAHTLAIDTTGSVVLGDGKRLLAVVGMRDVVVVDTGDAVLVLPKDQSQDVKKVVEALKASRRAQWL